MGRSKFSFPLPGRRNKAEKDDVVNSKSSLSLAPTWPSRYTESPSTSTSKAHRVLGTSEPMHRTTSKQSSKHSSTPPSSGYMAVSVSETSLGTATDVRASSATDESGHHARPGPSARTSLNALRHPYVDGGVRRGSNNSLSNLPLHPQRSSSTMHSHYDAKTSPLSISQQTSNSAVRDMALRRGKPQVVSRNHDYTYASHESHPSTREAPSDRGTGNRRSKPAQLDIAKLFPKPRSGGEGHDYSNPLLSPTKMVDSPAALSVSSEYFPRPMTREPTPQPAGSRRTATQQDALARQRSSSPVRLFQRDVYDSAKIHVRRPPKGIQHWFEGALEDDSDEALEEVYTRAPDYPPEPRQSDASRSSRQNSLGRVVKNSTRNAIRAQQSAPVFNTHSFAHEDVVDIRCLTPTSDYSIGTLSSMRTKASQLSKSNLQDSSMLSFSSSEDEGDRRRDDARRIRVRRSLDLGEDAGEIIIGQAQAFEMRSNRRTSGGMSLFSNSTDAATIEVMYTPEPPFSPHQYYSKTGNFSGNRRSNHIRQPSVIPEDEDVRPRTAVSSVAYSTFSGRTSASEPKLTSHAEHKMMAVTAEEEALLELMRKKRAAMNGSSQASGRSAGEQLSKKSYTSEDAQRPHQSSTYLSADTYAESPVKLVETRSNRQSTASSTPSLLSPRARPTKAVHETGLHGNPRSDTSFEREAYLVGETMPPHHSRRCESPQPDSYLRASPMLSPTTADRHSPLPSPITPCSRPDEADLQVKVASSETSSDDEVAVLEPGVNDTEIDDFKLGHIRRRTLSSGAEITFPAPPGHSAIEFAPVSEPSSRTSSTIEPPISKFSRPNSKRISGMSLSINSYGNVKSSRSSVVSNHSYASSRGSRMDRKSSLASMNGSTRARNSVSDDVLAAWGNLGGTY